MKKLSAFLVAAMLVLALPAMAFAAPSPDSYKAADGSATFTGNFSGSSCVLAIKGADTPANTKAEIAKDANLQEVGTWEAYCADSAAAAAHNPQHAWSGTATFAVGTQYNGATAKVYIIHGLDSNGAVEGPVTATVNNGKVTVNVDGLSFYTVAVDKTTVKSGATSNSATSPQTGVGLGVVAGATAAMAAAAAACAFALRKKED